MKKLILVLVLGLGSFGLSAQVSDHALGLRFGGSNGLGTEITYQKAMGAANRLQLDLGLRSSRAADAFKLSGTYQWVKPIKNDFYWFYGGGAGLGYVDFDNSISNVLAEDYGALVLSVEGIVGVEYNLANIAGVPIQLALDFNPNLNLLNDYFEDFDLDLAFSARWQF